METKTAVNTLVTLAKAGQSPWYDNIERGLIKSGKLKKLFENGLLGVTSNPTIFEKAVSGSDEYDKEIKELSKAGKNAAEIYDELTLKDISDAADLLKNTYEKSGGLDGYVSIEVLPEYAHDARKTIESGTAIFERIGRPNIMIKVPGTEEGPEAVRELTGRGVNVNVTLLFSEKQYEMCALAYIEGLKKRIEEKKDLKRVFSVASIFVSRIDTKADALFAEIKKERLKGRIAVANSKMIYQKFKKLFLGEGFSILKAKGANLERVVWASTSTKNPEYHDLKYVEELIGPHTINTMPPQTVDAFLEHGKVSLTVEKEIERERAALDELRALGIDIESVCRQIQDAGVVAFQDSFDKLIRSIEKKKS